MFEQIARLFARTDITAPLAAAAAVFLRTGFLRFRSTMVVSRICRIGRAIHRQGLRQQRDFSRSGALRLQRHGLWSAGRIRVQSIQILATCEDDQADAPFGYFPKHIFLLFTNGFTRSAVAIPIETT